jgi:putative ABC transport system permease protein
VLAVRRGRHPAGLTSLAAVNVLRTPGRSVVGALSLAVGVAALTLVTGVTTAFRGVVVGSLLGDAVAVQVRAVDYVAVAATVALGVLAVADVVALNIRISASDPPSSPRSGRSAGRSQPWDAWSSVRPC